MLCYSSDIQINFLKKNHPSAVCSSKKQQEKTNNNKKTETKINKQKKQVTRFYKRSSKTVNDNMFYTKT